jgi:hypothetical protein
MVRKEHLKNGNQSWRTAKSRRKQCGLFRNCLKSQFTDARPWLNIFPSSVPSRTIQTMSSLLPFVVLFWKHHASSSCIIIIDALKRLPSLYIAHRLCGLEIRVSGYRSRGPGFDSRPYQIFWEVRVLERGPLGLVKTTEELLQWKSSGSGLENRD